jgi:hypothetical protein
MAGKSMWKASREPDQNSQSGCRNKKWELWNQFQSWL